MITVDAIFYNNNKKFLGWDEIICYKTFICLVADDELRFSWHKSYKAENKLIIENELI